MAQTDFDQALIEVKVSEVIDKRRPPVEVRDKVDISCRIEDQSDIILEMSVDWKIYWRRADVKWYRHETEIVVSSFAEFLIVVDENGFLVIR